MAASTDPTAEVKVEGETPNLEIPVTWELLLRIRDSVFKDAVAFQHWDSIARDLLSEGMEMERIRVQRLMTTDPQEGIWLSLQAWFSTGGKFRGLYDVLRNNRLHSLADNLIRELQIDNEDGNTTVGTVGRGQTGGDEHDLLSKTVSYRSGLIRIGNVISQDRLAMDKWRYIKDHLVRNHMEAHSIDKLLKAGDHYQAISLTLRMWTDENGEKATWSSLINLLRSQGLMRTADKLVELSADQDANAD